MIFFWQKGFYFLSLCMILTLLVMTSPDLTAMLSVGSKCKDDKKEWHI
jgi:hypothetical protein